MTNQNETIRNIVEFLTAGGNNSEVEAINYWREGVDSSINEAKENDWSMKGDWREVWKFVPGALAENFHLGQPFVYDVRTGEVIGEATIEDCQRYLELVDDSPEGAVDGEAFGRNGAVFLQE